MTNKRLTFSNKIIFGIVMRKPELCRKCLELILNKKIVGIDFPQSEKTLDLSLYAKSIRMDIYCDGEEEVYNIEMQNYEDEYIPKRGRYYQDLIDMDMIEKGESYSKLKKNVIIFICRYDCFGKGRYMYTFENRCIQEPDLRYGDETQKIILNTKGTQNDVSLALRKFLKYIETGEIQDEYTGDLEREVDKIIKDDEWRDKLMTLEEEMNYQKEYFFEKGINLGVEKGMKQGIEQGTQNTTIDHLRNLMASTGMSIEQAMDALMISMDDREKYKALLVEKE